MHPLVLLAKKAVESYILERKTISPTQNLPKEFSRSELAGLLENQAGVFVTIKNKKELRGCIGTYLPTRKNIIEEIIQNAISAATSDYRFNPIQKNELSQLNYSVEILNKPKLIAELNPIKWTSPKIRKILFNRINPKKYGIIVKNTIRCGLLLPNLEGIDTPEKQFFIACQKADIDPHLKKISIYKFSTQKFQ